MQDQCKVCGSTDYHVKPSEHLKVLDILGYNKTCLSCGHIELTIQKNPIPVKE